MYIFHPPFPCQFADSVTHSDYKDDGTNILLDANENAYGPGLALTDRGTLANGSSNGDSPNLEIDLLGLNRYPDPYGCLYTSAHCSSAIN